jgi:hypothetical protein
MQVCIERIAAALRQTPCPIELIGRWCDAANSIFSTPRIQEHLPAGCLTGGGGSGETLANAARVPTFLGGVARMVRLHAPDPKRAEEADAISDWIEGNLRPVYKGDWVPLGAPIGSPNPVLLPEVPTECAPALKKGDALVLRTLGSCTLLVTAPEIRQKMIDLVNLGELPHALSLRTIKLRVNRLISLGLAERPEGDSAGSRLTVPGRRLLPKITL